MAPRYSQNRVGSNVWVTGAVTIFLVLLGIWLFSSPAEKMDEVDTSDSTSSEKVDTAEGVPSNPAADSEEPPEQTKQEHEKTEEPASDLPEAGSKSAKPDEELPSKKPVDDEGDDDADAKKQVEDEGEDEADAKKSKNPPATDEGEADEEPVKPKKSDNPAESEADEEPAKPEKSGKPAESEADGDDEESPPSSDKKKTADEDNDESEDAETPKNSSAELQTEAKTKPGVTNLDSQKTQSIVEKEFDTAPSELEEEGKSEASPTIYKVESYDWPLCPDSMKDHIPCLDNTKALKQLRSTSHYEHRERHCPSPEELNRCLIPLPEGYKEHIPWPLSRDKIWYSNVPYTKLISYKADQNWVKREGDELIFPGGGTQFKHGAQQYIDFIQEAVEPVTWGDHVRQGLDMGCGVASWGAYLFKYNTTVISMAPKDEHEAQVQFALERGVPALLGVMGTQRLPFPSNVFDVVHCARCRVPWHLDGGMLLLEVNRVLRPGGLFLWSATPVYSKDKEDVDLWDVTSALASGMCWKRIVRKLQGDIGIAVWQKPTSNACFKARPKAVDGQPPMCDEGDEADAAWYVPMKACLHYVPEASTTVRGGDWPVNGVARLTTPPPWLESSLGKGVFGGPLPREYVNDIGHWQRVVRRAYSHDIGIDWAKVRNVMDMNAHYGGFATALANKNVWVMNVVPVSSPDTLPVIFERGLVGVYHDWCESFNTYPRTYDLLHLDHLFGDKPRCDIADVFLEMDRILRPKGWAIVRERKGLGKKIANLAKSLHWDVRTTVVDNTEVMYAFQKGFWRPSGGDSKADEEE